MSLYNPQVLPCVSHTFSEELYKATLCNLAWGKFFWRTFLLRAVGAALWIFVFSIRFSFQLKTKRQCAAGAAGPAKTVTVKLACGWPALDAAKRPGKPCVSRGGDFCCAVFIATGGTCLFLRPALLFRSAKIFPCC